MQKKTGWKSWQQPHKTGRPSRPGYQKPTHTPPRRGTLLRLPTNYHLHHLSPSKQLWPYYGWPLIQRYSRQRPHKKSSGLCQRIRQPCRGPAISDSGYEHCGRKKHALHQHNWNCPWHGIVVVVSSCDATTPTTCWKACRVVDNEQHAATRLLLPPL